MARIICLDGLRGIAALWVLIGHTTIMTGVAIPSFARAHFGVDLFIMLSGFLMTYQYRLRREREDWEAPVTWLAYWVRRFFRIAPLYFLVLAVALGIGGLIHADRMAIDTVFGGAQQSGERYLDASATNIAMHLTFLFGLFPQYAFRTPLPDWSIGLEMQFYAVFPFIVLASRRLGWLRTCALLALGGGVIAYAIGLAGIHYPMPSFLPLKLHLFIAGMLIAAAPGDCRRMLAARLIMALAIAALPIGPYTAVSDLAVRVVLTFCFFMLVHWRSVSLIDLGARLLGSRPAFWMGELSYGVYLVHLLVLTPVAAAFLRIYGPDVAGAVRFLAVFGVTAASSYALAYAGYRFVERPGQALGRRVLRARPRAQAGAAVSKAEFPGAP